MLQGHIQLSINKTKIKNIQVVKISLKLNLFLNKILFLRRIHKSNQLFLKLMKSIMISRKMKLTIKAISLITFIFKMNNL